MPLLKGISHQLNTWIGQSPPSPAEVPEELFAHAPWSVLLCMITLLCVHSLSFHNFFSPYRWCFFSPVPSIQTYTCSLYIEKFNFLQWKCQSLEEMFYFLHLYLYLSSTWYFPHPQYQHLGLDLCKLLHCFS